MISYGELPHSKLWISIKLHLQAGNHIPTAPYIQYADPVIKNSRTTDMKCKLRAFKKSYSFNGQYYESAMFLVIVKMVCPDTRVGWYYSKKKLDTIKMYHFKQDVPKENRWTRYPYPVRLTQKLWGETSTYIPHPNYHYLVNTCRPGGVIDSNTSKL